MYITKCTSEYYQRLLANIIIKSVLLNMQIQKHVCLPKVSDNNIKTDANKLVSDATSCSCW